MNGKRRRTLLNLCKKRGKNSRLRAEEGENVLVLDRRANSRDPAPSKLQHFGALLVMRCSQVPHSSTLQLMPRFACFYYKSAIHSNDFVSRLTRSTNATAHAFRCNLLTELACRVHCVLRLPANCSRRECAHALVTSAAPVPIRSHLVIIQFRLQRNAIRNADD